jgi:hypothetical protein
VVSSVFTLTALLSPCPFIDSVLPTKHLCSH